MTAGPAGVQRRPPRLASSAPPVITALTGEAAAHLAEAIAYYARGARRMGVEPPPELLVLARQLRISRVTVSPDASAPTSTIPTAQAEAMPPLLVARAGAARLLGVSESTVDRLARRGDLPAVRVGGAATRYRTADLATYVAQLSPATRPEDHPC